MVDIGPGGSSQPDGGVSFTPYSAQRIAKAVKKIEQLSVNRSDGQRQYQPPPRQTFKIGKTNSAITADGTGTVSIWRTNPDTGVLEDTGEDIEDVRLDWMHGDQDISSGKEVRLEWYDDENIWRITHAECE